MNYFFWLPELFIGYFHFVDLCLQPKLLGMLPSLASHSVMVPLIVQTILPMLHEDTRQ